MPLSDDNNAQRDQEPPWQPDQIVVATDQEKQIFAEIDWAEDRIGKAKGGERYEAVSRMPALGLTLVQFDPGVVGAVADQLAEKIPEDRRQSLQDRLDRNSPDLDLDKLLTYLRGVFEQRAGGYTPSMGKNRTATGIGFYPYANAHGLDFDLPRPPERGVAQKAGNPELDAPVDAVPAGNTGLPRRVRVGMLDTQLVRDDRLADRRYFARSDGFDNAEAPNPIEAWRRHAAFVLDIVTGTAPTAEVEARTALRYEVGQDGKRGWTMPLWRLAESLLEFEASGVEVLNLSLGFTTNDGAGSMLLDRVINRLAARMIIVAAAGNYGDKKLSPEQRAARGWPEDRAAPLFPAALDNVIAVGALDGSEMGGPAAAFNPSNGDGRFADWIDVFAPGTATGCFFGSPRIPVKVALPDTTLTFEGEATWTGTSFAAARITGEIAKHLAEGKSREAAVQLVLEEFTRPS